MFEVSHRVRFLLSTITIAVAIEHDICGRGPHLYNSRAAGFTTIYQLFGKHVRITANVTERSKFDIHWGIDRGDVNKYYNETLIWRTAIKVRYQTMDITLLNKTLDGYKVYALVYSSEIDSRHCGRLVTIRAGEAPSANVVTQVCKDNVSVCANMTGMPHPSISNKYELMDRPIYFSQQRSGFCATVNRSATIADATTNSKMTFTFSNCFGQVIITVTIPKYNRKSTSPCKTSRCSITNEQNNPDSCSVENITTSIYSIRFQNASITNSRITNAPTQYHCSRPSKVQSSTAAFAPSPSTSTVKRNVTTAISSSRSTRTTASRGYSPARTTNRDSKADTSTVHISSILIRSTHSSERISHTSNVYVFPGQEDNSSSKSYVRVTVAIGAVGILIVSCLLIFVYCKRRRAEAAVVTTPKHENEGLHENRGLNMLEAQFTVDISPNSVHSYDELKLFNKSQCSNSETHAKCSGYDVLETVEHQYAYPVSPTKSPGRHSDGYDHFMLTEEGKPSSGKSEQSMPDISPGYAEIDQSKGPEKRDKLVTKKTLSDKLPVYAKVDKSNKSVNQDCCKPNQKDADLAASVNSQLDVC